MGRPLTGAEKQARYQRTAKGRERRRRSQARYARDNPEKIRAHWKVQNEVRTGRMTRPDTCARCGAKGRIEASHDDYDKPLDVEWLCRRCHMEKDGLL